MPNQILIFLLDTILSLFSLALLLRFYCQLLHIPYYNPVSQFLIAITDFIVRPIRRFIPSWGGIDLSTLILAWILECVIVTFAYMAQGYSSSNIGLTSGVIGLLGIAEIIKTTLYLLLITIIMQSVLSWVNPHSPLAPLLDGFTRPFLAIFRRNIPPIANVDLSPLFALILIQVLLMLVAGVYREITTLL